MPRIATTNTTTTTTTTNTRKDDRARPDLQQQQQQQQRRLIVVEMGLTARGLDDVGDVTAIQSLVVSPNDHAPTATAAAAPIVDTIVQQDHPLVRIDWEGHSITSADELYHTVWETFEGETRLTAPLSGQWLAPAEAEEERKEDDDNDESSTSTKSTKQPQLQPQLQKQKQRPQDCYIDDETILIRMAVSEQEWETAIHNKCLVNDVQYRHYLQGLPPGQFVEPVDDNDID